MRSIAALFLFPSICLFADEHWIFDRLDRLGGHATTVEGRPTVVPSPLGPAIQFNGKDDVLFLDIHPLAGAATFTWEVIFRPDRDGGAEQRFFHFQESGSENRLLLETRIVNGQWCLDSYVHSNAGSVALLDRTKLHSTDEWHHVAMVYDGTTLRHYSDRKLQGEAPLKFAPHGPGRTSVGTRINRKDYFKGAIRETRMTSRALAIGEFLPLPSAR